MFCVTYGPEVIGSNLAKDASEAYESFHPY